MTEFTLDQRLENDTCLVKAGPLSDVRLMNDSRYPWLVLVPRIAGALAVDALDAGQRTVLMEEIVGAGDALKAVTGTNKLNWASLGNHVPQLHVHVIARFETDAAWPNPIWGVGSATPYDAETMALLAGRLAEALP